MLSIDRVAKILNLEQVKVERRFELPDTKKPVSIFDRYIVENKYEFINKRDENVDIGLGSGFKIIVNNVQEKRDTFIKALLSCIDEEYRHISCFQEKGIVTELKRKLIYDLTEQDLYHKYGYNKDRKMSKTRLQKNYMENIDFDANTSDALACRNYVADYFPCLIKVYGPVGSMGFVGTQYDVRRETYPIVLLYYRETKYFPITFNDNGIYSYALNPAIWGKLHDTPIKPEQNVEELEKDMSEPEPKPINEPKPKEIDMEELKKIAKKKKILLTYTNESGKRTKKTAEMLYQECFA